ncbi:MAG: hypothetical protein IT381_29360 [Deltaproteobacteria bacterium]|nr:hypothetical protein [Deltaproteobacteria bacterium]
MKQLILILCLSACVNRPDYAAIRQLQNETARDDDAAPQPEEEPEAAPNTDADEPDADEAAGLRAVAVSALAVTIDRSALVKASAVALPLKSVTAAAFEAKPIAVAFSKSQETFQLRAADAQRQIYESVGFKLLRISRQGAFVLAKKVVADGVFAGSEATLAQTARASLKAWGIDDGEVGRVLSRKVLSQEEEPTGVSLPKLHRYKTFIERAIGGVSVIGHRAVITHGKDGAFARATVVWPPLATAGHRLATRLSVDAISDRAKGALAAHGIAAGNARLRYKYLPTLNASGEAVLLLAVGANVDSGDGEAHEVDVEIDAE